MSDDEKIIVVQSAGKLKIASIVIGFILLLAILGGGAWFLKKLYDDNRRLRNEITEFKALTENLVRSSTKWATKGDLKNSLKNFMTKEDRAALEKDIKAVGGQLTAVGRTVGRINRRVATLEKSDREGPENTKVVKCNDGRLIDVHGYTKKAQIKELRDANKAPVASATFNAAKKKPWSYEVYGKSYHLVTAVSRKDSGQMVFHHQLKYGVPGKSDKKFPVKLQTSEYLQVPTSNKMYWWNPKLDVNLFVGGRIYEMTIGPGRASSLFSFGGDLGVTFSSYGPTKVDSIWRFFRLGAGYDAERQAAHFSFAPVSFNLGRPMPLLTNFYLAPQIALDTAGGITLNLGLGFQL